MLPTVIRWNVLSRHCPCGFLYDDNGEGSDVLPRIVFGCAVAFMGRLIGINAESQNNVALQTQDLIPTLATTTKTPLTLE
jgi:hypothetical protein